MDKGICLEFMKMHLKAPISPYNGLLQRHTRPHKTQIPFIIINKIKVTEFVRPKSAMVAYINANIPRLLNEITKLDFTNSLETHTNPYVPPRPGSSFAVKRKRNSKKVCNLVVPTANLALETNSSAITDMPPIYPISKYEEQEVNEPNSAIQEYISMNPKDSSVFATEIPNYVYENFPKRKIKHKRVVKSKSLVSKTELPHENTEKKVVKPLQPSYFHLKRRYHPVKCKANYITRFSESPVAGLTRPKTCKPSTFQKNHLHRYTPQ